jgi:ATP/maltotriose-dependent transcriptional regulator MalT
MPDVRMARLATTLTRLSIAARPKPPHAPRLRSNQCLAICLLAETYFTGGRYENAMDQVNQAITTSSKTGDRWCLPLIYMTQARLLQQTFPNADAAEASLRRALQTARQ